MRLSVLGVGIALKATETRTGFSVQGSAILKVGVRGFLKMDDRNYSSILLYKTTMAAVKTMLNKGLITEEEFNEIEGKIANKYGLNLSVIYR